MRQKQIFKQNKNLSVLSSQKYKGKHIVMVKDKIFASKTGQEAAKIFKEVIKKYPKEKPTITYIPKEDTLILFFKENGD
ncbi:MAG: DUF5678 domain-containing protein [Patescibacteria group bacterium]